MDEMRVIGERLTLLRNERGLTTSDLSKKTGLPEKGIQNLENSKRLPTIPELVVLGRFFNVSYDYLVGRCDNRIAPDFLRAANGDETAASLLQFISNLPQDQALALIRTIQEVDLGSCEQDQFKKLFEKNLGQV